MHLFSCVFTILIHPAKAHFQHIFSTSLCHFAKDVTSLLISRNINTMILMPQILDITANENVRYKRNDIKYDTMYMKVEFI